MAITEADVKDARDAALECLETVKLAKHFCSGSWRDMENATATHNRDVVVAEISRQLERIFRDIQKCLANKPDEETLSFISGTRDNVVAIRDFRVPGWHEAAFELAERYLRLLEQPKFIAGAPDWVYDILVYPTDGPRAQKDDLWHWHQSDYLRSVMVDSVDFDFDTIRIKIGIKQEHGDAKARALMLQPQAQKIQQANTKSQAELIRAYLDKHGYATSKKMADDLDIKLGSIRTNISRDPRLKEYKRHPHKPGYCSPQFLATLQ